MAACLALLPGARMSIRLTTLFALLLAPLLASATAVPTVAPVPAAPTVEAPPPPPAPSPRVLLVTSMGEILVELDAAAAPATVENFLSYARDGHYNGTTFHRAIPGLLLQGGAFTPDLQQKPSRSPVASEAGNGLSNRRGTLAAARDRGVVDSATAQFFFNLADNPKFDRTDAGSAYTAGYTVFGRVIQGLDVVDRIAAVPTGARGPFPGWVPEVPVVIERVELLAPTPAAPAPAAPAPAAAAAPEQPTP
jgi:cyclophilin family peptidyl-prolyl cis-trans isomerase